MKRLTVILVLVVATSVSRGAVDFSRYAPILERRPFSSPVVEEPVAPPPAVTVEAPPAFVQDLRMVAITESPAGVRAGFVNIREKTKTYFLYVGDTSEDGILLAEADFDGERALLRKGGEQFWLAMGGGEASAPGAPAAPPARVPRGAQRPTVVAAEPPEAASGEGAKAISYADRRRQRIEEMSRRAEESRNRNLSEEEVEKRLREYQMKLIREGKTPLPIPITEEMDAQLVKEGILPAVE